MFQNIDITVNLTSDLLTLKSIGIIYGPWPTKSLIMVSLSLIGFKLISEQGFYASGHCDLDDLPTNPNINHQGSLGHSQLKH